MLTWAQKRQVAVFIVIFISAVLILGWFFLYFFGGGQDDAEIVEGSDFSILWARFFKTREGLVDLAALLENPNNISAGKFKYSFKVYDQNNILITIKEGESYAGPNEKFVLFEPNIATFQRIPSRVIVDIENIVWQKDFARELPLVDVLSAERFLEDIFPRLVLNVKNSGGKTYENLETIVVLWRSKDEIAGVSRTLISRLGIEEERQITFTWPEAIGGVVRVEAFFRLP